MFKCQDFDILCRVYWQIITDTSVAPQSFITSVQLFSSRQESETPQDINLQQYRYKNINCRNYMLHADLDGKIIINLFTK